MSNLKIIYKILKAIDVSYENNNFDYEKTFSLSKLKISEQRLELLLENLVADGYINGISIQRDSNGMVVVFTDHPRLTTQGVIYLEENSFTKKIFNLLKEAKEWIPGF